LKDDASYFDLVGCSRREPCPVCQRLRHATPTDEELFGCRPGRDASRGTGRDARYFKLLGDGKVYSPVTFGLSDIESWVRSMTQIRSKLTP